MKSAILVLACSCITTTALAQELLLQQTEKYDPNKTIQFYALVQPLIHQQNFLNEQLQNAQLPLTNSFNIGYGLGIEYSFRTGTSLRLETIFNYYSKERSASTLDVRPINYDFMVKQLFFRHAKIRPYVAAGAGGWEQTLRISRRQALPGTIQDLLNTPNTIQFTRATDCFVAAVGLNLKPLDAPGKRVTEFTELEFGFRSGIGEGFLYDQQTDLPPLLKDSFRQFYCSIKAGISYRRKKS